jgi:hypothetical protein
MITTTTTTTTTHCMQHLLHGIDFLFLALFFWQIPSENPVPKHRRRGVPRVARKSKKNRERLEK